MDNNDYSFDRAKFDAVWQRVMPGTVDDNIKPNTMTQKAETHDTEQLCDFMDDEANDAQIYCLLASKCSGCTRQMLSRISADERSHLKKLRAKYFILTGETYTPPNACPLIYSVPDTLRKKYSGEKEGSAAYRAAAEKNSHKELADTYLALSEDEARHSRMIGCIIENMM
jgi:rubrerythrin